MKTETLKLSAIGNSRGVRLPAGVIRRYNFGEQIIAEMRDEGLLLKQARRAAGKLSWEETAKAMSASPEDWSEWEAFDADGLDQVPWNHKAR